MDELKKELAALLAKLDGGQNLTEKESERVAAIKEEIAKKEAEEVASKEREEQAKSIREILDSIKTENVKKKSADTNVKSTTKTKCAMTRLIEKVKKNGNVEGLVLSEKAGEFITPPSVANENGSNIVLPQNRLRDLLDIVNIIYTRDRVVSSVMWEATNPDDAPAWIGDGDEKPQLEVDAEVTEYLLKKVASRAVVSDTILEDDESFSSKLEWSLYLRLRAKIIDGIIDGDGTGNNLRGLTSVNGVQHVTATSSLANDILDAMTQVEDVTGLQADTVIVSPAQYKELISANIGGAFIFSNPATGSQITPWGIPNVVRNTKVTNPIVGAFNDPSAGYLRMHRNGAVLEWSNSDKDNFSKDLSTIRNFARCAWVTENPAAFAIIEPSNP